MKILKKIKLYGPKILSQSKLWPLNKFFQISFFYSEIKAVESGIKSYKKRNLYSVETQLRRNIHRLEKGLINKQPKSLFGIKYIEETIIDFKKLYSTNPENDTVKWATDILFLYFQTIDYKTNELTKNLHNHFHEFCIENTIENKKQNIPYRIEQRVKANIKFEELNRLFQQRRSVRSYLPDKVPREITEKALQAALCSPSGCNRQPFDFHIIDDNNLLKKVSKIPPGAVSFAPNAPNMLFVVGNLNAYFSEADRHLIYLDSSMAMMSFILALETFGVSSCIINIPDDKIIDNQLRQTLDFEKHQRCILAMTFGYPSNQLLIPNSMKKNVASVIKYNK